ncbi:hypothetical protein BGW38_000837 [Lunasporangiospora selenospora]|uniref:Multiple myeloma tumor-associated protein 2-like N-terminal domain-containing protein n=1 Tax=Lunasporangiospora selenospora TaxID=979761 RepID=A0A9P6FWH1_9FUNG|nr:hypothetical protein BGW38_000837 [Lunasporangiospora selenospora]
MFHPTRGGTRGGRDQFKWEDVKEDKYRENYLGNSLHASVGRWQKGRDLTWYAKSGSESDQAGIDARQSELQRIKELEAEALAQALGVKTKRRVDTGITEKELKSAISKSETGGAVDADEATKESSSIQGLGFK